MILMTKYSEEGLMLDRSKSQFKTIYFLFLMELARCCM